MKVFKKVMMALDMTEVDRSIMGFVDVISKHYKPESIYAVNVVPTLDEYDVDYVQEHWVEFLEKRMSLDEVLKKEIKAKVSDYIHPGENDDLTVSVEVLEGTPIKELIHRADIKKIDLLVVGNKKEHLGTGVTSKNVVRQFSNSVLFVPEKEHENLDKIIVPIDFSENSATALKEAIGLHKKGKTVTALHVIDNQPISLLRFTKNQTSAAFQDMMNKRVNDAWNKFCETNQIDQEEIKLDVVTRNEENIADVIESYAENKNADLLIMGARGHSRLELSLFGSTTEKVLQKIKNVPVMIIK